MADGRRQHQGHCRHGHPGGRHGVVGDRRRRRRATATNRAAGIQAQGVLYRAETNATLDEYKAGLTEWAGETNYGFAQAPGRPGRGGGGARQADIINRSTARTMGRATAAYGAAGVSGGSSLYVLNDLATEGELQANLATYGGKVQAGNIRQQATFDLQAAESPGGDLPDDGGGRADERPDRRGGALCRRRGGAGRRPPWRPAARC